MFLIAEGVETKAEIDYLLAHTSIRLARAFGAVPFFVNDYFGPDRLQAAPHQLIAGPRLKAAA